MPWLLFGFLLWIFLRGEAPAYVALAQAGGTVGAGASPPSPAGSSSPRDGSSSGLPGEISQGGGAPKAPGSAQAAPGQVQQLWQYLLPWNW